MFINQVYALTCLVSPQFFQSYSYYKVEYTSGQYVDLNIIKLLFLVNIITLSMGGMAIVLFQITEWSAMTFIIKFQADKSVDEIMAD